ncbi:MAG: hypothetical protein HY297_01290, partial [Thaumarchaeota archaeon]|nr:hypothetical protein [Nitrososphaerota archaeon]
MGLGEGVPWERLQGYIDGSFSLPRLAVAESQVADGIGRGVSVFDMRVVR